MLSTMNVAIVAVEVNPNTNTDVNVGFVCVPKQENIALRMNGLKRAVELGSYTKWSGADRRKFVAKALRKGNQVEFRECLMPFNKGMTNPA